MAKDNVVELPKEVPWNTYFTLVEPTTGEVKAYLPIAHKKKGIEGGSWVAVFQDVLGWLAKQSLPLEQYRVLMFLMCKLDFSNYIRITQTEVARELNMHQPHVSRAIKGLLALDIIAEGPHVGNAKTYRLNPRMAHKGRNQKQTIIEYDDLKKAHNKNNGLSPVGV